MMANETDLQGCESCNRPFPIETMHLSEDCWICRECDEAWRKGFDACAHKWEPHVNAMGDPGKVCVKCCGFVADEDELAA